MAYGIRILALVTGAWPLFPDRRTPFDGQFVRAFDPDTSGFDPQGRPMIARLDVTDDPARALSFITVDEAMEFYRQQASPPNHLRPDGRPNRPLTAFTIEIVPLRQEALH